MIFLTSPVGLVSMRLWPGPPRVPQSGLAYHVLGKAGGGAWEWQRLAEEQS